MPDQTWADSVDQASVTVEYVDEYGNPIDGMNGGQTSDSPGAYFVPGDDPQSPVPEPHTVVDPPPVAPPRDPAPGLLQRAVFAGLAGCLIGVLLTLLLRRLFRRGGRAGAWAKGVKVVTLQGLGARENQQDSLAASDPAAYSKEGLLVCVADGMGGLQNGSLLSRTAVTTVMNRFASLDKSDPERVVASLVQSAVSAVNTLLSPNFGSGGTTLLIAYARESRLYFATVGDSRICLLRKGELIHLNRPHVYEDELLLRYFNGELSYEDARNYKKKGGLTSYLGMGPLKYVDFPTYHVTIREGDRVVLMSDGVFNTVSDARLSQILAQKPKKISASLNREIEKQQKQYQDNYSAAVIVAE